jgi:IPT/TIG domain
MRTRISVAIFAALVGCGSSNNVTCGDGTTLVDGVCELGSGSSGGSNTGDTCGSGTTLQGTTCVATGGGGDAAAPTITMITPSDTGVSGLTPFEIDGTGFAGDNVTSLTVFFGDTTNMNCEAPVIVATATTIAGQIPPFCDINVTVSVTTNLGTATTPFHYDAIFAADGDGSLNPNDYGVLWVIDPFTASAFNFGYMADAAEDTAYAMAGIAFDSTGKLWGVTTGNSIGDVDGVSQLVTIDPTTPDISTVTTIADITDAAGDEFGVNDIKIINGTLYAWAYITTADDDAQQGFFTIDMTTGVATALGTPAELTFGRGGFAVDGSNTTWLAANGAGSDADSLVPATGELDTVDLTSGAVTASANVLDWPFGAPINSMDYLASAQVMLAVVDNGSYGVINSEESGEQDTFGETLAVVDPTTGDVEPAFELPAQSSTESFVQGIAIPSSPTATLQIAKKVHAAKSMQLKQAGRPVRPAMASHGSTVAHRFYR